MTYSGDALYDLQQIDLALAQQHKRLQEIRHLLENNVLVQAAQSALDAAQADLKPRQTTARDLELQTQAAKQKREATEQRLYSGEVKNPRELQDMQNEIASLTRWQTELDERLLHSLEAVEQAQAALETARQLYNEALEQVEGEQRELVQEKLLVETRLSRLEADRETLALALAPADLRLYDLLRQQKSNRAVSLLTDNACSVCGIEQTGVVAKEVRKREALVKCRNCGRILVYRRQGS